MVPPSKKFIDNSKKIITIISNTMAKEKKKPALKIGEMIRRIREAKGWSREKLAEAAGLSSAGVYKIEQNLMVPTIITLAKIAKALKKDIRDFLKETFETGKEYQIIRKNERFILNTHELGFRIERVGGELGDRKMEAVLLKIKKGKSSGEEKLSHGGEEIHFILKGNVEYTMEDEKINLSEGDCIHFKATVPHSWKNVGNEEAEVLVVISPPPFV
jgi:transcriptional regulator with XRE-family HTH domain